MRRIINATLISTLILFLALSGCEEQRNAGIPRMPVESFEISNEKPISIPMYFNFPDRHFPEGVDCIGYIVNSSSVDRTFTDEYALERFYDGVWRVVPFKEDSTFSDEATIIPSQILDGFAPPKTTYEGTVDLGKLAHPLSAGWYRVLQTMTNGDTATRISTEFTVGSIKDFESVDLKQSEYSISNGTGISLVLDRDMYPEDIDRIGVLIQNDSSKIFYYGLSGVIERKVDGVWCELPASLSYDLPLIMLQSGKKDSGNQYSTRSYYLPMESGEYRFVKSGSVGERPSSSSTQFFAAEFEVTDAERFKIVEYKKSDISLSVNMDKGDIYCFYNDSSEPVKVSPLPILDVWEDGGWRTVYSPDTALFHHRSSLIYLQSVEPGEEAKFSMSSYLSFFSARPDKILYNSQNKNQYLAPGCYRLRLDFTTSDGERFYAGGKFEIDQ